MLRIMVVDDEAMILQGICESINWKDYGIQIVAQALNGKEALNKAIIVKPDIIITDIRMPVMDGIELTREITKELPQIQIIFLTGYEDFNYAKKAVELDVYEYLLKPVNIDELIKTVLGLGNIIQSEKEKSQHMYVRKQLIEENLSLLQTRFVLDLVNDRYTETALIEQKAKDLKVELNGPRYQVVLFRANASQDNSYNNYIINKIKDITEEVIRNQLPCIVCVDSYQMYIALINQSNKDVSIVTMLDKIMEMVEYNTKVLLDFGVGKIVTSLDKLPHSYMQAFFALRCKKSNSQRINYFENVSYEKLSHDIKIYMYEKENKLIESIKLYDPKAMNILIDDIFRSVFASCVSLDYLKKLCLKIILIIEMYLEGIKIDVKAKTMSRFYPTEIKEINSVIELKTFMRDTLQEFINLLINNQKEYSEFVVTAINYIQNHFDEEITLKVISDLVYVTPSYFSKIFKQETGENFTEYLNRIRIERSLDLIKDKKLKTYEIASKVGYNDYKYFSSIFKKITNYSPREYRKRISRI